MPKHGFRCLLFCCLCVCWLVGACSSQTVERYVVTNFDSPIIQFFDPSTSSNTPVFSLKTGGSTNAAVFSPDNRLVYIANLNSEYVSVVDVTIRAEIRRIYESHARALALTADGSRLVAVSVSNGKNQIDIINTSTYAVEHVSLESVNPGGPGAFMFLGAVVVVGNKAYITQRGSHLYQGPDFYVGFPVIVVNLDTKAVSTVTNPNPSTNPDTYYDPWGVSSTRVSALAVTPDNAYVLALRNNRVLLIQVSTDSVVQTIGTPGNTSRSCLAVTRSLSAPGGVYGYVGTNEVLKVINLNPGPNFATLVPAAQAALPAGFGAFEMALTSDSSRAILTSNKGVVGTVIVNTAALLTNPAGAVGPLMPQTTNITGVASGAVLAKPPSSAPVIQSVTPTRITNDAAALITISGYNFADDAEVRIGNLSPITPDSLSRRELTVSLPQFATAQNADVIVTNRNSYAAVKNQHESGIAKSAVRIDPPMNFQPIHPTLSLGIQDQALGVLRRTTELKETGGASGPAPAVSPDGSRVYVPGSDPTATFAVVRVVNIETGAVEALNLPNVLPLSSGSYRPITFGTDSFGDLNAYLSTVQWLDETSPDYNFLNYSMDLAVIGADPNQATYNTVKETIHIHNVLYNYWHTAITPDGRFLYMPYQDENLNGQLAIVDLASDIVTTQLIPVPYDFATEVSPDGQWLVLINAAGNIDAYSLAIPSTPRLISTITMPTPTGSSLMHASRFAIGGGKLYVSDPTQALVAAFNFLPAENKFELLGTYKIDGAHTAMGMPLALNAEGDLLHVGLSDDAAAVVLNTARLIAGSDPTVTRLLTSISPSGILTSPGVNPMTDLSVSAVATPTRAKKNQRVTYSFTVTNNGPVNATNVVLRFTVPASLTGVTVSPGCSGDGTIYCTAASIRNGDHLTYTLTGKAPASGTLTTQATVAATIVDGNFGNNTASSSITVK